MRVVRCGLGGVRMRYSTPRGQQRRLTLVERCGEVEIARGCESKWVLSTKAIERELAETEIRGNIGSQAGAVCGRGLQ